jgi:hypothetical protein
MPQHGRCGLNVLKQVLLAQRTSSCGTFAIGAASHAALSLTF